LARFNGCFSEIDFAVAIIRNIRINNPISVTARVITVHFLLPLSFHPPAQLIPLGVFKA
jgi:hypothetical protein